MMHDRHVRFLRPLTAAVFCLVSMALPVLASDLQLPSAAGQAALVKSSLLTFNDANVSGIYTVMLGRMAKPFRDQFTAQKLGDVFKGYRDNHINFAMIAALPIMPEGVAKIDDKGVLKLKGQIVINDKSRVDYDLNYLPSEGDWKLIDINVNASLTPPTAGLLR